MTEDRTLYHIASVVVTGASLSLILGSIIWAIYYEHYLYPRLNMVRIEERVRRR
jgi:hypothetical protein